MIPVFRPSHDHQEANAVARCLSSGWTGLGPRVEEFERKFAEYVGVPYAVATSSCTAALHLAYRLVGVCPGDEVIVPSLTFISTALAATYCGATPVFADSHPDTLLMDYDHAKNHLNPRTKAISVVLYGGQTISSVPAFYCDGEIPIILDCAHACGSGQDLSIAPLHCWSFHSVKNLSCGDGGMLTMHRQDYYERAKRLRWCGIDTSTYDRAATGGKSTAAYKWDYAVTDIGFKYHMNDITASIGLVQLAKMPEMQQKRFELACRYMDWFGAWPNQIPLKTLPEWPVKNHARHLQVLRCDNRNALADHLRSKGINTGVHYKPIHLYPVFRRHGASQILPVVEREWQRLLTLPLFPDMTLEQVDHVCDSIKEFYAHHS